MVEKIQKENWTDYDAVISTPDMMKSAGKLSVLEGELNENRGDG